MTKEKHNAIVLNWNESHVSVDTINILLEEGHDVIVVDNGSDDQSDSLFRQYGAHIKYIRANSNYGSSVGRNAGIQFVQHPYTFLIDGDILYVRGTINSYAKILNKYPDAGCVGYFDYEKRSSQGEKHGANRREKADKVIKSIDKIGDWYPMAWTQYGLFRSELLKKYMLVDIPPFNKAGYGYEDDWLYRRMKSDGWRSLHVTAPYYYHDSHYSLRLMEQRGMNRMTKERGALFNKHWSIESSSTELMKKGIKQNYFDYKE